MRGLYQIEDMYYNYGTKGKYFWYEYKYFLKSNRGEINGAILSGCESSHR